MFRPIGDAAVATVSSACSACSAPPWFTPGPVVFPVGPSGPRLYRGARLGTVAGQDVVRRGASVLRAAVGVALIAVAVDVGVAVVRAVRSRPRVVERGTGRAVDEPRPFAESAQIVLAWTTVIGGRVLSRSTRASRGLERLTVAHGEAMDQPATSDDIDRFIAAYSIDVGLLDRHPHEFATINELFADRSDAMRGRWLTPRTRRWR